MMWSTPWPRAEDWCLDLLELTAINVCNMLMTMTIMIIMGME